MKPFWIVCLLAGGLLGIVGSCGPQHRYCPKEPDMECRPYDDGGGPGGQGGGGFNPCPDGGSQVLQGDAFICM
jgi:hypothetical protein